MKTEAKLIRKLPNPLISAVDLFCGAGGLTRGLENTGVDVRLGIDTDPACEFPYTANNNAKFLLKSVEDLKVSQVKAALSGCGVRLVAGCAPCQTFSTYNQKARPTDSRWWLLKRFSKLVNDVMPEIVTMENVPGLSRQDVFEQFVKNLECNGFNVSHCIVDCAEFGVPQHRERLVLLASRLGPISLQPPSMKSKEATVRTAIGNLPRIAAGGTSSRDRLHHGSTLSELNLRRIKASKPGGTWREWDDDLIAACHKKATGKTYPSVYGRMRWNAPAPTITTQFFGFGNGRFGHPEQDRAISLREGAILQSFPRKYRFVAPNQPVAIKSLGRLIGNAVPVKLAEAIGKSIVEHVKNMSCMSN